MKNFVKTAVCALMVAAALPVAAQWRMAPTPNDTLQSRRVLPDGSIELSIYAPKATEVGVTGDAVPWTNPPRVTRNADGVWTAKLPPVEPGVYRYGFVVDGVRVSDPKAESVTENQALVAVGADDTFFALRDDVPHGAVAQRVYNSSTLGTQRRLHVWTPAGYEKSTESLPVLYLIHGGGDNDMSWPTVGCAGAILDNLLAEGRMKPMIVVMPNGTIHTETLEGEVPLFAADLMTDIIPFIEANYRVLTDKDNRALAGLSMGGMETLEAGLNNFDKFGYLWVLSSGWFPTDKEFYAERGEYLKKIAPEFNRTVRRLAFTQGGPEDIAYNNCKAMLRLFDDAGINYTFSEAPGGHTWYTWRRDLYNLAQELFK